MNDQDTPLENWEQPMDRKARLHLPALRLSYRPAAQRRLDFDEACLGFSEADAQMEASRCIACPAPEGCILACPLHNHIPQAMSEIARGNFLAAGAIYRSTSNFPEVCGRLCPDEELCAGSCVVGKSFPALRLGRLEAFAADYYRRQMMGQSALPCLPSGGRPVAVIGSGPAGLTCAEQLALQGHAVTIFEMRPQPGGMLIYTIPAYRLPPGLIHDKVTGLQRLGVRIETGMQLGQAFSLQDLFRRGFRAVFLSTGAGFEPLARVPGETARRVYRATEFLLAVNLQDHQSLNVSGASLAVFGSGLAAVDCVRSALRLGASQVTCYVPGDEKQATWRSEDRLAAEEEGAVFISQVSLLKIMTDAEGNLGGVRCQRTAQEQPAGAPLVRQGPPTSTFGRFVARADLVVLAPERGPDPHLALSLPELQVTSEGWIVQDPVTGLTSLPGVFAAGDATGKYHLAAYAIAQARKVAAAMHAWLVG